MPHIILFLLVSRENSDLLEIVDETIQHGVTERSRTAGN
jgi:hypothetical protein